MRTVVVSDLHLGSTTGRDLAGRPAVREALARRVETADRLVLLGDVLELREAPLAATLARAEPTFRALGEAIDGTRVTIVPGNHDHRLAAPLLEARSLEGDGRIGADEVGPASAGGPVGRVAAWLAPAPVEVAYPGTWLRPDVYATHGHYLDCNLALPALEPLLIAALERLDGGPPPGPRTPADYEDAVAPVYGLAYELAQSARTGPLSRGGSSDAARRRLLGMDGPRSIATRLAAGVVLPGAVGLLNRLGFGPLTADLSGPSLRRSALFAMARVATDLGVDAATVVFGHTHRSGPWPNDDASEWALASGGRLINSGSWFHEPHAIGASGTASPYWPGTCVVVEDDGPPRLERLLDELPAGVPATRSGR